MAAAPEPPPARPLILTLCLPHPLARRLDSLRRAHYPRDRNRVPAHLSLFRHLPGPSLPAILDGLAAEAARTPPVALEIARATRWQESVVLPVRSPELEDLRTRLAERWQPMLIPADRAPFRPHVTIASRLGRDGLESVLAVLDREWPRPVLAQASGLLLWRYDDGSWSLLVRRPLRR